MRESCVLLATVPFPVASVQKLLLAPLRRAGVGDRSHTAPRLPRVIASLDCILKLLHM